MLKNYTIIYGFLLFLKMVVCLADYKKICYFTNWAQFRQSGTEFLPEDIDPKLCTHIIYAHAKIENFTLSNTEPNDVGVDNGPGLYERIMVLKLINPSLKIMLGVGGWAQGSSGFETVVQTDELMEKFAKNSVKFLRKWKFDGLDIDWEYPIVKKKQFTKLIEEIRIAFDTDYLSSQNRLELSIAVSAGQATIDMSYDIEKISQYVDFINLAAYDFHESWNDYTGFHSSLYPKKDDLKSTQNVVGINLENKNLNLILLTKQWAVNYWIKKGCPRNKLILGIPFYGRGFTLKYPKLNQVGSPSKGISKPGQYTKEAGVLSYFEICEIIRENYLDEKIHPEHKAVSLKFGDQWIGYDNEESIILKSNFIKENCLGGAMIWTIDFDDFKGNFCNKGAYPLLNIINGILNETQCTYSTYISKKTSLFTSTKVSSFQTTKPRRTTISQDSKPTTISKSEEKTCSDGGFFASPIGCEYFRVCLKGFSSPVATVKCPDLHWFHSSSQSCIISKDKTCINDKKSTTVTTKLSVTNISNKKFSCPEPSGLFANTEDSEKFWHCANYIPYEKKCPNKLTFDNTMKICREFNQNLDSKNKQFSCPEPNGLFKDAKNSRNFWHCSNNHAFLKKCPINLYFNERINVCDYLEQTIQRSS